MKKAALLVAAGLAATFLAAQDKIILEIFGRGGKGVRAVPEFRGAGGGMAYATHPSVPPAPEPTVNARNLVLLSFVAFTVAASGCGRYSYRIRRDVDAGRYSAAR